MKSKNEILDIINNAHGTEAYHKFSSRADFPVVTDGVIAVAEAAGCYWLLDIIGSNQTDKRLDPNFQVWKLVVNHEDSTAVVSGYNDTTLIVTQDIPYTDFPLDEFKLFLMDGVILLPSEHWLGASDLLPKHRRKVKNNKRLEKEIMKTLELTHIGRDSWDRPVYECYGKLYCDVDPRKYMPANICTKANNEFDGEPDSPIGEGVEVTFIPARDTW